MEKLVHNDNLTKSQQSQERVISDVLYNYQQTVINCQRIIQQTKEKIGKRVVFETKRIPMLENMIQESLKEIALSGDTCKPHYRAFGELRNYTDEQVHQLQKDCPDIQSLLEYYQQKDKEQLDSIICGLQSIVDEYKMIADYCTYMITNANNRNSITGAQLASYGLNAFSATKLQNINHIQKNLNTVMNDYNTRVASEGAYTEIQTFTTFGSALSN